MRPRLPSPACPQAFPSKPFVVPCAPPRAFLPNAQGMAPVTRTYNTLMIACNSSNQWHEALSVYAQLVAAGQVRVCMSLCRLVCGFTCLTADDLCPCSPSSGGS